MTGHDKSGIGRLLPAIAPVLVYLFSICSTISAQRTVAYEQFPTAYFDSVRAMVNDTTREHYTINAYRLSGREEIVVDGYLNEPAWKHSEHQGGFLEKEPYPLAPMSEETEFAVLYDHENLYIGVWCWDSEPEKIKRLLLPRGSRTPDNVDLFIDSYHDHRTGYKFSVSPTGVQVDELRYDDVQRDDNWNGVWYSAGSVDDRGWYAEIKIPFFNFRFTGREEQTWGFNIMRNISKDASRGQWKPHLPEWDNTTRMSQLGDVENIRDIQSGRTFEIRPYGTAGRTETVERKPSMAYNLGADIRYSPSPNLTCDLTLNPDFAQIDADVFEINLTRYPTRFRDLRPFFTERTSIFNTPLELFYSRRIGARGDILAGGKITGKLQHGLEFGMLGNLTGRSPFSSSMLDPEKAGFGVFRIKKDILGSSSMGLLAATKEEPGKFNRVIGMDGSFILNDKNILVCQVASGKNELGFEQSMAYDVAYTRTGDLIGAQIELNRVEPAFEINRIGYIRKEPDRGWNSASGTLRFSPRINQYSIRRINARLKFGTLIDIFTARYIDDWMERNPEVIPGQGFATEGTKHATNLRGSGDLTIQFINEMSFHTTYQQFSATELTGDYSGDRIQLGYATRPLRMGTRFAGKFSANSGTYYNFNRKYVGIQRGFTVNGDAQPLRNLITKLQGGYTRTYDPQDEQDGRYFKLSSNSTWMFTKDLFIRLHVQGIFGTTYYDREQTFNDYLISCLFSWEYRPGSFLYLAYNEGRFDEANPDGSRYFAFNDRTLMLKISYFFSI